MKLLGISIVLCMSAFLLRSFGWRGAPVLAALSGVFLLFEAGESFFDIIGTVNTLGNEMGLSETVGALVKVIGLGYLFGICADLCRELGESGIAKAVEVVGRVEIIAIVIPYFEKIIKLGVEFIK